jgi:TPR repeat protein
VAVTLFYNLQARYENHGHEVSQNDRAAEQAVGEITRCAQAYRNRHPEKGFPAHLAEIGPGQEECLTAGVASGEDQGYRFVYVPGLPDTAGQIRLYSVVAQPAKSMETGSRFFASDESGSIAGAAGTLSGPPMTASETWWNHSAGLVLGVRHCALLAAAQQPAQGYPASLADLGPSGTGCLKPGLIITQIDANEVRTHYQAVAYVGGPADTQGRVSTFAIYSRSTNEPVSFFTDESGAVHVHHGSGWASARDPAWQPPSMDNMLASSPPPPPPGEADLDQGCASGRLADCLERGTRLLDQARLEESRSPGYGRTGFTRPEAIAGIYRDAELWFAKGCNGGLAAACLALGRSYDDWQGADRNPLASAPLFRKACDAGDALGCYNLGQVYEEGRAPKKPKTLRIALAPSAENASTVTTWEDDWSSPTNTIPRDPRQAAAWYSRGCELGSDDACESAGVLFFRGEKIPRDMAKAAAMFQSLCDLSRATGCAQLRALYTSGDGVPRNASQAAYLSRKACALGGGSLCDALPSRS